MGRIRGAGESGSDGPTGRLPRGGRAWQKPAKKPYYIHATDNAPLFFADLSNWRPNAQKDEAHGFAIVTNDAAGGMIDVHDRRPVALPVDLAIHWMDPEFRTAQVMRCWSMAYRNRVHLAPNPPGGGQLQVPDAGRDRADHGSFHGRAPLLTSSSLPREGMSTAFFPLRYSCSLSCAGDVRERSIPHLCDT
ncbi:SOS response-associated peptidase family protein [Achromobacter xylosoxidans]